jgi:DNA repair exonuclease SbcCD ATPase subunit
LQHLQQDVLRICPSWELSSAPEAYPCRDIQTEWSRLLGKVTSLVSKVRDCRNVITSSADALTAYYEETGKTEQSLLTLMGQESQVRAARRLVTETDAQWQSRKDAMTEARGQIDVALAELGIEDQGLLPDKQMLQDQKSTVSFQRDEMVSKMAQAKSRLDTHKANIMRLKEIEAELEKSRQRFQRWERLNSIFGGTRFRTLVQTYILRPLLNNANIYLEQITDRYRLTCNETNEQLSILVLDRYNKNQVRSVTVLSGGERFMISLALSLALSSLNRPDMNVNILFIDEGFGTLDEKSLDSVMSTLEKLQEIAGQTNRRVGIISHREELEERIPVKIQVVKKGEGRSQVVLS